MHILIDKAVGRVKAAKEYGNIQEEFTLIFNKAVEEIGERRFVSALYDALRDDPEAYNYARQMVHRSRRSR
jgi:hypothetical protein